MIKNQDGQVAVKWTIHRRMPPPVIIDGTNRKYIFAPKSDVFMAWVQEDDAKRLLVTKAKSCNCAGGTYAPAFDYASRLDVILWLTGDRNPLPEGYMEI